VIAGTRGGSSRARIILALKEQPKNASQLAKNLKLDYKTVRHHLDVLVENKLLVRVGDKYAATYFLSSELEYNYKTFKEICGKVEKKNKN